MRRFTTILLPLALLLAAACGDSPTEPDPTVDGTWRGTFVSEGDEYTMTVTMNQGDDGSVDGTGAFGIPGSPAALTFTIQGGSFSHPNLNLTLAIEGVQSATYTGTLGGSQITGSLTGSGFTGESVVLVRQ